MVSVIIPNYNHSEYLVQRIESILNQTYQNFDIILLDDCSSDDSRDILDRYRSHPKVAHVLFNTKNSGSTFKQWEKGILHATGKYILIAESDDWCSSEMLQFLVDGIEQSPNCVISYCQAYFVNNTGDIEWTSTHNRLAEMVNGKWFSSSKMLLTNPIFNASMVLWKRECYAMISQEFKQYTLAGDWLFWIELSRLGKVHISGRVLNYFRRHDKNVSGKAFKSGLNFVETLTIINSLYLRGLISIADNQKAFKIQYWEYYKVRKRLHPDIKKQIKQLFRSSHISKPKYYQYKLRAIWKDFKSK